MKTYIGIDPGKSGAIAFIRDGSYWTMGLDETLTDISEALQDCQHDDIFAFIEKVHSSPQMGVKSAFTFGQSYGSLEGVLIALNIPFERVTPQVWQREMKCMTKGDKNVSKRRAQELFPNIKITHRNADALLIAEYGVRSKL